MTTVSFSASYTELLDSCLRLISVMPDLGCGTGIVTVRQDRVRPDPVYQLVALREEA